MKLTAILLFVVCVTFGNTFSQVRLTVDFNKADIRDVLQTIEEKTDYIFLYKDQIFDFSQKISVEFSDAKFEDILKSFCNLTGISYEIRNRQIILTGKEATNLEGQQQPHKKEIKGKVTDAKGEPIPGTTVLIKGTTVGAVTNSDGSFSLSVPVESKVLTFSFVGFKTQEISIGNKLNFSVELEEEMVGVEEVVVVGYGTQKKINVTGAVDVVSGEKLANRPASNVSLLLQGAAPNLNISLNLYGGEPGAQQRWQLRGIGSISGNDDPLVLVDGVEMDINLIDPESIESVSVLKDASASAVYGSRAAFGVILVTTKKGKKNQPLQIQYSNNLSFAVPIYIPSMEDSYTYAIAFNQAQANAGLPPKFPDEQVERIKGYIAGTYLTEYNPDAPPASLFRGRHDGNANYNWTKEYYKSHEFYQKHNVNLNGGDTKTQYYFTAGFYDQPGLYSWGNDGYKRYNLVANITSKVNDWIRFDFSSKYAKTETNNPYGALALPRTYIWSQLIDFFPTMPKYNIDGTIANPLIHLLEKGGRIITENNDLWMNLGVELEPVKGWKTNIKYNYNAKWGSESKNPKPVWVPIPNGTVGNIGEAKSGYNVSLSQNTYSLFSAYTAYEKTVGSHYFKALVGYEQDLKKNRGLNGSKMDLITLEVPSISTALGDFTVDDWMEHWATQGIFGRLNYNYNEKYLVEFSGRYDGSSKFAKGSRWGFFPSGGLGWNVTKENFWTSLQPYVNTLKLRATYGSLGNQNVANYLYMERFAPLYNKYKDIFSTDGYIIDNEVPLYVKAPILISSDLTWETVTTLNLGLDAGFLNDRLGLVFEWYNRTTTDMIGPAQDLPSLLGASAPKSNNAELSTKGFEISLSWRDRISTDFSYNARFTLGDNQTTILKFLNTNGLLTNWYAGKKYGEIWGYTTDGIIQTVGEEMPDQSYLYAKWGPGDMKYKDIGGPEGVPDGKIDRGAGTLADHGDLSVIGNSTPRYNFSISAGFNWKNFDFNMLWQGIGKCNVLPGMESEFFYGLTRAAGGAGSALFEGGPALDYWRPADETNILGPNTDAYFPKPYFSNERTKNVQDQSRYVLNAAYVRLKNLQVGYTIPQNILNKAFIDHARIYFSGENLLTFSKLPKILEPETSVSSNSRNMSGVVDPDEYHGVDLGEIYPITKMFSFGVTLTF